MLAGVILLQNCTWTPPGTTSNADGGGCCFGGGGVFEDAEEWRDGICGDTASLCTTGLFRKEDFPNLYNRENNYGPGLNSDTMMYCAKVIKGTEYGFWYPVEAY